MCSGMHIDMPFSPKTCANSSCPFAKSPGGVFHRKGFFKTKRTNSVFRRYMCVSCKKYFSSRTFAPDYRQKKKDLNPLLSKLLTEGQTIRAAARTIGMTYRNTYNKFLWLARQAKSYRESLKLDASTLYFDEMETIEHTKCKPVSILLLVNENYRILEAKVAQMPAKGRLAAFSRKKYGRRQDLRSKAIRDAFRFTFSKLNSPPKLVLSDAKPSYKPMVKEFFSEARHLVHSREDKDRHRDRLHERYHKKLFDPMFVINQRCAKLRSDIRRLTRRSWCTTKKVENLQLHLDLYLANQQTA